MVIPKHLRARKLNVYIKPELHLLGEAIQLTLGANVYGSPYEEDDNGQELLTQQNN